MACCNKYLKMDLISFSSMILGFEMSVIMFGVSMYIGNDLTGIEHIKPFIQDFVSTLGYPSRNYYILIAGGGLIVSIVSIFGCWGSIKNDSKMFYIYALIHSIFLIYFVVLVIYYYQVTKNFNVENMESAIADEFSDYQKYRGVIDPFQKNYTCCGFKGQADYTGMHSLPYSCCPGIDQVEKSNCTSSKAFNKSCKERIQFFLAQIPSVFRSDIIIMQIMQYLFFGMIIIQKMFFIVLSMYLARRQKTAARAAA